MLRAMALWRTVDADTEALYAPVDEWLEDADYASVTRAQLRLEPSPGAASAPISEMKKRVLLMGSAVLQNKWERDQEKKQRMNRALAKPLTPISKMQKRVPLMRGAVLQDER